MMRFSGCFTWMPIVLGEPGVAAHELVEDVIGGEAVLSALRRLSAATTSQAMVEKSRRALSRPIFCASLRDSKAESNQAAASSMVS